jgi:hypothetical protein
MAAIANLRISQGTNFSSDVTVTDNDGGVFDLTDHSAYAQLSTGYASTHSRTTFTTAITQATGIIRLSLNKDQTGSLDEGRYVYDVTIVNDTDSTVTRVIEGIATVLPRVSSNY